MTVCYNAYVCVGLQGAEAADDRKIFESHVESGKIFRLTCHTCITWSFWWYCDWDFTFFCHISRHLRSTNRLRTAQSTLSPPASLKNVTAPPCCLSVLCRRWGMTYSCTSACRRYSRFLSCSSHPHSSTGSATWGTASKWETKQLCLLKSAIFLSRFKNVK